MSFIVPDAAEADLLTAWVGQTASTQWTLRLFKNNYVPVHGSTEANFTEATGGGYAAKVLTPATWIITPGSPSQAVYPTQSFVFTGAAPTIYGFYVTRQDGHIVIAEPMTPYTPANPGDHVDIDLLVTLASRFGD